jgi:hypothetical protein
VAPNVRSSGLLGRAALESPWLVPIDDANGARTITLGPLEMA